MSFPKYSSILKEFQVSNPRGYQTRALPWPHHLLVSTRTTTKRMYLNNAGVQPGEHNPLLSSASILVLRRVPIEQWSQGTACDCVRAPASPG